MSGLEPAETLVSLEFFQHQLLGPSSWGCTPRPPRKILATGMACAYRFQTQETEKLILAQEKKCIISPKGKETTKTGSNEVHVTLNIWLRKN